MKKFQYKLAGVLRVRKIQEDQVRAVISQLMLERKEYKEKVEKFNRELVDSRKRLCQPGKVNAKDFTQNEKYIQGLTSEIKRQIERIRMMDMKIENHKKDLNAKRLETRKLEIHEGREKELWKEEYVRKEQAEFDDLASVRKRFLSKR
ncbi:MAG: flagellar FliJ family protein [Lentisphaeraceae bacterium]|nr:flagellar FliJ family protein [Lentisphaeraceae bacterium]